MFKSSRPIISDTLRKTVIDDEFIIQKLASVDGNQTVKKYKKLQLLGKGGFANCYATESVQTKHRAATKVIQKQVLTSQKTKLRLLNEIRLHKTLHHENIVEFYHYFEDKSSVYIFLQLCQNQSLNETIRARQSFTTPEIQSFVYGIVNGLKYLHGKGIMHRDLKLGNVFLDKSFKIKLGDFGLATKLQFKKQCKRTICGTPNYIAPEILQGQGYHFQVDIWAIGVIIYTLFYTIPPFQTQQASTTYQKIKKCDYSIPKYGNVPAQAVDLIERILVRNPWQRPTLDEILQSEFMKLGNKIYKQLPHICSRKAPMKRDFQNLAYWTHEQLILNNSNKHQFTPSAITQIYSESKQQMIEFITAFESLTQDRYFYLLNTGTASIFTPREIVFRDDYGMVRSFDPNDNVKVLAECEDNPLKYMLNCQIKMRNQQKRDDRKQPIRKQHLLQATLYPCQLPLHIKKVSPQLKHHFHMVRLSNQTIQLIFQDKIDYLLNSKGDQIHQIKNSLIIDTLKLQQKYTLSHEQLKKIGIQKGKFIQGVLTQIKTLRQKVQVESMRQGKSNNKKASLNKQTKQQHNHQQQVQQTPKFFQKPPSPLRSKQKRKSRNSSLFKSVKS